MFTSNLFIPQLIETLKLDLPTLFTRDISYDIYTDDIEFRDPVNRFRGQLSYRIVFWTLRFHGGLFFTQIHFHLHDVSLQDSDTIIATWTVRGTLRVPWKARLFFNGYSTYKFNELGLIYEHIDTWDRSPQEILKQFFQPGSQDS